MIKKTKEGFKLLKGTDGIDELLFDTSRTKACFDFMLKHNIKRISLNPYHGFKLGSLDFLIPMRDFLEGLIIGTEKLDLSALGHFKNLNFLGVPDNGKDRLDLSKLRKLKTLACDYSDRLKGLETCSNIESLTLSNYKSQDGDLTSLPELNSLEHLSLIQPKVVSLKGIEKFKNLKKLEIYGASKLETIAPIQLLSNSLENIEIERCKKIKDYEALRNFSKLKKIIISESGEIKTLVFITTLPKLKFLSFVGTNVLDGDISYCEGLSYVGFDDKRHYSHKMKQFETCSDPLKI
jgi:Leucine-rich repeat (LRR) protein